ncbi:MAG: hypothetical protein Q9183_003946 [Haloplaca sp. 2 TL-2023]
MRTNDKNTTNEHNTNRAHDSKNTPPPNLQLPHPPQQAQEEEQEGEFDGEQGDGKQDIGRSLELQIRNQHVDVILGDGAGFDNVLDKEVGDVDVQGRGSRDQSHDGEEEEAVVNGEFASLDDADICAADGEGDCDAQEGTNGGLRW